LGGPSIDYKGNKTTGGLYEKSMSEKLNGLWKDSDTIEQKWNVVRSAFHESTEAVLGIRSKENKTLKITIMHFTLFLRKETDFISADLVLEKDVTYKLES